MSRLPLILFTMVLAMAVGAGARAGAAPSAEGSRLPAPFLPIASSSLSSTESIQPSAAPPGEAKGGKDVADAMPSWQSLSQFLAGVPAGVVVDIPFHPTTTPIPSTAPNAPPLDAGALNRSLTAFREAQQALYIHSYQKALLEINRAIEELPNIALFHALKGSIFYSVGDYAAARIAWKQSLTLDSTVPLVREMLERIADRGERKR